MKRSLVTALLFLAVCFHAARSQDVRELRSDQASAVQSNSASGVTVASEDAFQSLDTVDTSRYQREDSQTGKLIFVEEDWIDSIKLTIFFPRGGAETVTLESDGFTQLVDSREVDDGRLRDCTPPIPGESTQCLIDDDWILVVATVDVSVCSKTWDLVLRGARTHSLQFVM